MHFSSKNIGLVVLFLMALLGTVMTVQSLNTTPKNSSDLISPTTVYYQENRGVVDIREDPKGKQHRFCNTYRNCDQGGVADISTSNWSVQLLGSVDGFAPILFKNMSGVGRIFVLTGWGLQALYENGSIWWNQSGSPFDAKWTGMVMDDNNYLYFINETQTIHAVYAVNGTVKWFYKIPITVDVAQVAGPVLCGDFLYFQNQENGSLFQMYRGNGTINWMYSPTMANTSFSAPVCGILDSGEDMIYYGSDDLQFKAIYARNGTLFKNFTTRGEVENHAVIDEDGFIWFVDYDGIETTTGGFIHKLWPNMTEFCSYDASNGNDTRSWGAGVVYDNKSYFALNHQNESVNRIISLDKNCSLRWEKQINHRGSSEKSFISYSIDLDIIYVADTAGYLSTFHGGDGNRTQVRSFGTGLTSTPIIVGDAIIGLWDDDLHLIGDYGGIAVADTITPIIQKPDPIDTWWYQIISTRNIMFIPMEVFTLMLSLTI